MNYMSKLLNNALMASNSIEDILVDQNKLKTLVNQSKYFTHTVDDLPAISDQKQSGRCWMFADLMYFRTAMIRKYKLSDTFDFSTSWLYFHDKLEKFRNALMNLRDNKDLRKATPQTHLLYSTLTDLGDGGWSDYLLNITDKYGIVPKDAYGESTHTEKTKELRNLLSNLFIVHAYRMRNNDDPKELSQICDNGIKECRKVLEMCLGTPPDTFIWQYRGESDEAKSREIKHKSANFKRQFYESMPYTPLEYWQKVKDACKLEFTAHTLLDDPLKDKNKVYHGIKGDTNVNEQSQRRKYLNLDTSVILDYVRSTIRQGYPVIIYCDFNADVYYAKTCGVMSVGLYQYEELCPSLSNLTRKELLESQVESINHAVCIVGYNTVNETWKIANSWGSDRGYSGHWIATTEWFQSHMCTYRIPLSILSDEHKEIMDSEPWEAYTSNDVVN
jgi:bleomycin hydrolase